MDEEKKNEILEEDFEEENIEEYVDEYTDRCIKEEKKFLKTILTWLILIGMILTSYLFIVYLLIWIAMRVEKLHLKKNIFWNAYDSAFKKYVIVILVLLVALGGCFFVLPSL